jgi:hypothetical protein
METGHTECCKIRVGLHAKAKGGYQSKCCIKSKEESLVGYAASIYIDQSGSGDPGEWDHFVPTEPTELTDIPTQSEKATRQ